ncbi:MAG: peptide deformylase [Bacteroidales bacterium]|nr:peptide deformylase [Bacteroidales bacterium]
MILPIVPFGNPRLRRPTVDVAPDYPNLKELIANMYETMYAADGVGLAAPQIDLSLRLAVVGFRPYDEKTDTYGPVTEEHTLINPEILEYGDEKEFFNEGCLSVPDIHEDVLRPKTVKVRYMDADFVEHVETFDGLLARVAQHEIDHLNGKVFVDRLSPLRRTMLKRRLNDISAGKVNVKYKLKRSK